MNTHRVNYAIEFKNLASEFWIGLGRTTSWPDGEVPDLTGDETEVEELFGFILSKVTVSEGVYDKCSFVVEDPAGTIFYRGNQYRIVDDVNAQSEGAKRLYFEGLVPADEFPTVDDYRQLGIYYGLTRDLNNTVVEDEVLDYDGTAGDEVTDVGTLYALCNISKVSRLSDRYEKIQMMIEF